MNYRSAIPKNFDIMQRLKTLYAMGVRNVDFLWDSSVPYNNENVDTYLDKLKESIDFIVSTFVNNDPMYVNVITDIFVLPPKSDTGSLVCEGCPCSQCIIDNKLFKEKTNQDLVPFFLYCKKSFGEVRLSKEFGEKINARADLTDLNAKDWYDYVFLTRGDVGGVNLYGV